MNKKYLFGFDIGTYESKGTLCDLCGNVIATAASGHTLKTPRPGFAEHDPINDWWADFKRISASVLAQSGADACEIAAIGVSAVMAAITPVDENCEPLRNAILYGIDTRCTAQAEELNNAIGHERMREVYSDVCTVESFGPKILWIRENEPEVFKRTRHITMASGFITARLTGEYAVDVYSAQAALPMYDPKTQSWDEGRTAHVCDMALLPKIVKSCTVIGKVSVKAELETGLAAGTPVICGTTDAGAEAVSVGVAEPGDTMLMYGSTAFYIHLLDGMRPGAYGEFVLPNSCAFAGGMATTGSLTRWLRDNFAPDLTQAEANGGANAYTSLFDEAKSVPPGSDGLIVLPYFSGERMPIQDPLAKGMMFGLNISHKRGHIVRAALEGIGFGIDQNLELLRGFGADIRTLTAVGGGTKSQVWMQITSDICNVVQRVPKVRVGASYGDALLAGLAIGAISGPREIKELVKIERVIEPSGTGSKIYEKHKAIYRELYTRNADLMHIIGQ